MNKVILQYATDMSKWMLKNSAGERDGTFTFATISFVVVTLCVFLGCIDQISIGHTIFKLKTPDATLALGYLAASFSTYVVRRTTKDNNAQDEKQEEKNANNKGN